MKGSRIAMVFAGVGVLHLVVAGVVVLTGGCTHQQEVLQNRPFIPAPTTQQPVEPAAWAPDATALPATPEIVTEPELIAYTVKAGDSYWKIARQYGVSYQELIAFNKADVNKPLRVGATMNIPPGGALIPADQLPPIRKAAPVAAAKTAGAATASASKAQPLPSDGTYVVKSGDSLWLIARKFNSTSKAIADANSMSVDKPLQVGQKLNLPGGNGSVASTAAPTTNDLYAPTAPTANQATDDVDALLRQLEGESAAAAPATAPTATAAPTTAPTATPAVVAPDATDTAIDDLLKDSGQSFNDHQVLPGETLQSIADLYGLQAEDLRKANPAVPADGKLTPFSNLKVPNP